VLLSGCATSPEALRKAMGSQAGNPPAVAKSTDHPEPLVNAMINVAIEAATRLGFAYDASDAVSGRVVITAQWKGSPVVLRFAFVTRPGGMVSYTYVRECDANVFLDRGDAKICKLFEDTLVQVMDSRASSAQAMAKRRLHGTVEKGRYTDQRGTFSVAVPEWALRSGDVADFSLPGAWRVEFADDDGRYAIVETVEADGPEGIARLNSMTLDDIMANMVQNYAAGLPTRLMCHDEMTCAGRTGRFFVCHFTGGATISDEATGRRLDCYRAYFIFVKWTTLYTLTTQTVRREGVD